jgi:hypothetical protein
LTVRDTQVWVNIGIFKASTNVFSVAGLKGVNSGEVRKMILWFVSVVLSVLLSMSNQGIRKKCIKICGTNSSSAGQEMFAFY